MTMYLSGNNCFWSEIFVTTEINSTAVDIGGSLTVSYALSDSVIGQLS